MRDNDVTFGRSSFCNSGECVEVGEDRESKSMIIRHSSGQSGHEISFTIAEWKAFIAGVKRGEFDLD